MKKKIILTAAGCCLCCTIAVISAVSGTSAYMTDQEEVVNQVTVGHNTTETEEEFPTPTPVPPGDSVVKKVRVTNQGNVPCYIRVSVTFSESGVQMEEMDTENWVQEADGYYYYKHVVNPGDSTTYLFQNVTIPDAEKEEIKVNVYEESVQSTHGSEPYTDYKDAWQHYKGGEQS